jgi:hypothetical protein
MTPHERRLRELEASRRLQDALQALIDEHAGTIPTARVAEAFERAGSLLPQNSELLRELARFAEALRGRTAGHVSEESLRRVTSSLRQRSDKEGTGIERRDARLRRRR